ncbi:MAG TPA: ATP-binding protein, partial [Homoserinimonas sp.]|nr:ATP-binding protein [Homoserinimonas sp.]
SVLEGIGTRAEALVQDVRRIIEGLRPASLQSRGLGAAIKEAAGRLASGLHLDVDAPDELPGLEPEAEVTVFRVAVEAVLNAARHAQADAVRVRIVPEDDVLVVQIDDDGRGLRGAEPGVGIRSMRERVEAMGGAFNVGEGEGGRGTTVSVRIPWGES